MKNEIKMKHLEFIQGVIGRLANNSFLIKGWALTISMAGFGFFLNQRQTLILLITLFGTVSFWFLDGYFLRQEKLFRELYSDVASDRTKEPFTMNVSEYKKNVPSVIGLMLSYPTIIFYLPIIIVASIIYYYA